MAIKVGELYYEMTIDSKEQEFQKIEKATKGAKKNVGDLADETKILDAEFEDVSSTAKEVSKNLDDVGESADESEGFFNSLNGTIVGAIGNYGAVAGAIGGAVLAIDEMTNATITAEANQANVRDQLDLTKEATDELISSQKELGAQYGISGNEIAQLSSANSNYVSSQEELETANQLAIQTATLYALKEGDIGEASGQLVTAQEALRDTILNGSATAFEDAGLNLDDLADKTIEYLDLSDEQIATITEGTNGQLEYAEALLGVATPQERLAILAEVTDEKINGMTSEMSLAQKGGLAWQETLTNLQNVLQTVFKWITIIIGSIVLFIQALIGAITESDGFKTIMESVKSVIESLVPLVSKFMALLFAIGQAVMPLVITVGQILIENFAFMASILSTYVIPVIMNLVDWLGPKILWAVETIVPPLIKLVEFLSNAFHKAFEFLAPPISRIVELVGGALVYAIDTLLPPIFKLVDVIGSTLMNVLSIIMPPISKLADALKNTLVKAFDAIIDPIETVIGWFQKLIDIISDVISTITEGLIGALNKIPFVNIGGEETKSVSVGQENVVAQRFSSGGVSSSLQGSLSRGASGGVASSVGNSINNSSSVKNFNPNIIVQNNATAREVQKALEDTAYNLGFIGGVNL